MIDIHILKADSQANIQYLRDSLDTVNKELYKTHHEEGKWSIQQILEHLSVTERGVLMMGNGQTTETNRDPNMIIHQIRDFLGDQSDKRTAPAPVRPPGEDKSMIKFLDLILETRHAFIEQGESKGWHQILDQFSHPISGAMTRLEWLYFHIYHTERHLHQIKLIMQNPKPSNV